MPGNMDFNARVFINSMLSKRYLGRLVCHTGHAYSRTGLTTLNQTRDQTDTCTFQIPGYDCVAQGKSSSERGGLITYVDNLYHYEVRQSINEYELWEGQIIQVKGGCLRKEIIVGNIYRPPRTLREHTKQFINEFTSLVQALDNTNLNIVLAGDYNVNLLKINESEICCELLIS